MGTAGFFSKVPYTGGCMTLSDTRGRTNVNHLVALSRQTISTDPIGTHTLTLTNVVTGSRIHIQSGTTTLYDAVAASSTVVIPMQVYAGGSALNNWTIKIRKGSTSPTYRPYETQMTATVGASSIYVSQQPDE